MKHKNDTIPIHELKKQRRNVEYYRSKKCNASQRSTSIRNSDLHVRDGRIIYGYEDNLTSQIIPVYGILSFADRARINYINSQRILGTIWSTFK